MTTAVTPFSGIPDLPETCTPMVAPGPTGLLTPPVPYRVSSSRVGLSVCSTPPVGLLVKNPVMSAVRSTLPLAL